MTSPKHARLLILGSGPAGYTAAVYAARANLKPVLITGIAQGGQLMTTTDVDNWPADADGIQGPELMMRFQKHAERFATEIIFDHIQSVDLEAKPILLTGDNGMYTCDALIIATGASAKWLGIPSEEKFKNFGLSACATCDGALFKGRDLAVVGGGDTAMEEATFLTRFSPKVTLIHRREEFRASKIMLDRARRNPRIELVTNAVVDEILGALPRPGVTGVRLRDTRDNSTREMAVGGVFVAIGHEPNSKLFTGLLDMDAAGYIKTLPGSTATKIPGVFACGDVADHVYRQAVTAAGTGCMAAIDAERFLAH